MIDNGDRKILAVTFCHFKKQIVIHTLLSCLDYDWIFWVYVYLRLPKYDCSNC
jgi:hypothetical protein